LSTSVLVVEDEANLREALLEAVQSIGHRGLGAPGLGDARRLLESQAVDCVLVDIRLRDGDGLDLLREIRGGRLRDVPVIVATAYGDSERTIRAMRDGAFEYLTKPFDFKLLLSTVDRAVKQRALAQAAPPPEPSLPRGDLVGSSAAMLGIWKLIGRAAASEAPVLITGETGTGKELVARAIHKFSRRAAEPFVPVNLAALPPTLLESELFGHERGAFTGAQTRRAGRLESAGAGTLFLDEIGDLDPALQTKLLRVLAGAGYERVGGDERLESRARIVSATHQPARPGEKGCALREDLYYRLAVFEIEVPPLRERRSDIPLLVAHALAGTTARAVSEAAMAQLLAYRWPGNVRELIHVVERAAALAAGEIIDVPNLPESFGSARSHSLPDEENLPLREAMARVEKRLIERALAKTGGNRSEAARLLGIGRTQLYAKMEEHGIGGSSE
jgi:DNA-binding NtrC family response regulator